MSRATASAGSSCPTTPKTRACRPQIRDASPRSAPARGTDASPRAAVSDSPRPASERLDDALEVEEGDVAGASRSSPRRRARPSRRAPSARRSPLVATNRVPNLEQPHVALPVAAVVAHRVDEARQQRRPQHGERLRQRVRDRHEVAPRRANSRAALSAMNENVTHSLKPARGDEPPHGAILLEPHRRARRHGRQRRERRRQPVVAEVPGDLLDEIHVARDVDAPRRDRDVPSARRTPRAMTKPRPVRIRRMSSAGRRRRRASGGRSATSNGTTAGAFGVGIRVDPAVARLSGADLLEQRAGARERPRTRRRSRRRARSDTTLQSTGRASCSCGGSSRARSTRSRGRSLWSTLRPRCRLRPSRRRRPAADPCRRSPASRRRACGSARRAS